MRIRPKLQRKLFQQNQWISSAWFTDTPSWFNMKSAAARRRSKNRVPKINGHILRELNGNNLPGM